MVTFARGKQSYCYQSLEMAGSFSVRVCETEL